MEILLAIFTILGGIAAIWYFWDKIFIKEEAEKEVNNAWWEASNLKRKLENKGYSFRWSNADKVAQRLAEGYEIIFVKGLFKKHKLINSSGQILIGKKNITSRMFGRKLRCASFAPHNLVVRAYKVKL